MLHKILLTVGALVLVMLVRWITVKIARGVTGKAENARGVFWTRQIAALLALAIGIGAVVVIWVRPGEKALPVGLATAGLAVALQKVWTAFAGYLILLRGRVYTVGDRIAIGGVRGDVLSVGFLYTRIMEMGEPAPPDKRDVWVGARQFTGRIVTVTNDKIFDEPLFNYTREFPYLFEEITLPIKYDVDRNRVEEILVRCAEPATRDVKAMSEEARQHLQREYGLSPEDLTPRVYYRLTDNWLELTLRFVVREHGIRQVKDEMSRAILRELDEAGIGIASATFEIVGLPPLKVDSTSSATARPFVLRPALRAT